MIRDIQDICKNDIIRKKRIIGEMLYNDPDIIEVLDNPELDPSCPDEYLYQNIYPFIRVPGVQDTSKSYITYMLDDVDKAQQNKAMRSQFLKVVIFVHQDLVKTKWGIDRHDLLACLVENILHLSNKLGLQINLTSNREGFTDTNYCTRTLQFEIITTNSMQPFQTNQYERKSIVDNHDKILKRDVPGM